MPTLDDDQPQSLRVRLKGAGTRAKDAAVQAKATAIKGYWPIVERVCRERVGPAAVSVIRDDEKVTEIARTIYPVLPLALRLFVRESEFVNFCLANRDRLLLSHEPGCGVGDKPAPGTGSA